MISTIGGFFDLNHFDQSSRANDVIVIRHRDGSLHSTPFNVRFGRARIWNSVNKVVQVEVNGVMTKAVMKIGKGGEAFWLHPTYQRPSHPHEQKKHHQEHKINAHVQEYLDNRENILVNNDSNNNNNNNDSGQINNGNVATKHNDELQHSNPEFSEQENEREHELKEQLESIQTENSNKIECAKSPLRTSEEEESLKVHNCDRKTSEETQEELTTELVTNRITAQEYDNDKNNNSDDERNYLYANSHDTETTASPIASKNDVLLAEQVLKAAAKAEKRLSKLHVVNELLEWGVEHEDTVNSSGNNNYENINNIINTNHDEEAKVNEKEHERLSGKNQRLEVALDEALGQENSIVKDDNSAGASQPPAQIIKSNEHEKNYDNYQSHESAEKEKDGAHNTDDDDNDESVSNDYDEENYNNNNVDDDEDNDDDDDDDQYLLDPIDISDYTSSELRNREMLEPVIVDGREVDKQRSKEITKHIEEHHDMESRKKEEQSNANNLLKQIKENEQLLESEQEHLLLTEKADEHSLNYEQDEDERKELQRQQMEEEYEAYAEADQLPNWSFSSSVTSGLSVKDDSMLEPETSFTSEDAILHDPSSALRTHDQHYIKYALNNNAANNNSNDNNKIRSHVEFNVNNHSPAYAENTTLEEHNTPYFTRSLLPTVTDLIKLNLKYGVNEVKYVTRKSYDTPLITVSCNIYLWNYNDKIIVSDIDGTITKSDLWGHFYSMLGKGGEWTHPGICALYTKIVNNGYKILYLSARSVTQIYQTKNYLWSLEQEKAKLPLGPVLTAPLRIFTAITKEVSKQSHVFKIACLTSVLDAYPQHSKPFFAGFGNRYGDVVSYSAVHIPIYRIFIIDPSSVLHVCRVKQTYRNLTHLVDMTFPPLKLLTVLPTAPSWKLVPVIHQGGSSKNVEHSANAKDTLHHTEEQQEEKLSQLSDVQSNSTTSYNVDENSDDGKSYTDFADNYDDETGSVISVEHNDKNAREGKGVSHQRPSNHSMAFDLTNNSTLIDNVNGEQCTICTMYDENSQCREKLIKSNTDNIAVNITDSVTDAKANNESKDNMHQNNGDHGYLGGDDNRKYDEGRRHDENNSAISLESVNQTSVPRLLALGNQNTHKESRSPWHDQAINVNVNHINNNSNTSSGKSKHDFPLLVDNSQYDNVNDDIHVDPEFASFQFWSVNPADLIEPVHVKTKVQTALSASAVVERVTTTTNEKVEVKPALQVQKQLSVNENKLNTTQAPSMELPSNVELTDNTIVVNLSVNSNMTSEEKKADTLLRKTLIASPRQFTGSKAINDKVGENTDTNNNYDDKNKTKSTKEEIIANNSSDVEKSSKTSKQESLKIKSNDSAEKKSSRFFSFARVWSQNSFSSSKAIPHDKTEESIITPELEQKRYQHPDLVTYLPADAIALHKNKNVSNDVNNNVNVNNNNNNDVKQDNNKHQDELKGSTKDANLRQTPIPKSEGESVEEITPRKRNNDNVSLSPTTSMLSSLAFWKKNVAVPGNVNNNNKKETIDEVADINNKKDNKVTSDSNNNNNHSKVNELVEKDIKLAENKS